MRQNKKETAPATQKKRFGNRWLLALYDLLLLFMVDVVLLVLYRGMEGLKPIDIVVQGRTAAACIFLGVGFGRYIVRCGDTAEYRAT